MSHTAANLTRRTTDAAQWRMASAIVAAVSQFGIGVILARLLPPADFGLVALAFIVLGLVRPFGDLGLGNAVVQRAGLTERHIRVAFTLAAAFGIALSATLAALAPAGALLLHDARVSPVLRWLALSFAMQGLAVVAGALLRRRLDFRRLFVIDTGSYLLGYGMVAIPMAFFGYGVWSLVCGGLSQTLLAATAQLLLVRHSMRPLVARVELSQLLHFGMGMSLSSGINYIALNADNFIVGRWLGIASLGVYNRAYALMCLPYTYTASAITGVLFPAMAEAQADPLRLRRAYLLSTKITALVSASAMTTLAIAAPYLVRGLYGSRWTGVVAPLQILCIAGYFRALYHLGGIVSQIVGKVYQEMWCQTGYALLVIAGVLLGQRYGLRAVALGVDCAILYMFIAIGRLALRATATTWGSYLRDQAGALTTAAVTGAVALGIRLLMDSRHAGSGLGAIAILAGAAVPWTLSVAWHLNRQEFEVLRASLPPWVLRLLEILGRLDPSRAGEVKIAVAP